MIIYSIKDFNVSIITNPKSGVTVTNNLIQALGVEYKRDDIETSEFQNLEIFGKSIFVFRNPYQRVVSMFLRLCNTLKSTEPHKRMETENLLKNLNIAESGISFNQFLEYLFVTPEDEKNIHYRTQHIPSQFDSLVRTHRYTEDILFSVAEFGFKEFHSKLKKIEFDKLKKNPASKKRIDPEKDLSSESSTVILEIYKSSYPISKAFINRENISVINQIFSEEIEFAKRNRALQQRSR